MVWVHNKIKTTSKDDRTRYGSRKEKERQAEGEMKRLRQHDGMDRFKVR